MNQALQYSLTEDDEVEDLFLLLKEIKVPVLFSMYLLARSSRFFFLRVAGIE